MRRLSRELISALRLSFEAWPDVPALRAEKPWLLYRSVIVCKFAGNSDPLRGIIASNSDPF